MDQFDRDRLPALKRLGAVLAKDRNKELPAKQFDPYLRENERCIWRTTLARRTNIKAAGLEAELPPAARDYWDRLRNLYAQSGRKRTPQEERAFGNSVEDLWGEFQQLDAQSAMYFEEIAGQHTRWANIPHVLGEEFHVIKCGSAFHHWWNNPKGWSQWELAENIIDRLLPPDSRQNLQPKDTNLGASSTQVRDIIRRLNR